MLDHLKELAIFAKTVECGSFRAAARALAVSPSVLSHHVSELERGLGLALMYRTTRRLALTPDGEQLFEAAREMLAAAQRGLDIASGRSETPSGTLRLTAPAMLAETTFSRDLAAFSLAHPKVRLEVAFSEQRSDLLRDRLDLALRIGPLDDSALVVRKLGEMTRVLVAAPRYVDKREPPRRLGDLQGWDIIQLSARRPELTLTPPGKKAPSTLAFTPRIAVDSAVAMREMAVAGLGVAALPELLVRRELRQGRLVQVLGEWTMPLLAVHAVWPRNSQRPGLTIRFLDFIGERLAALFPSERG